jgi:hypothetical protein
MNGTMKTLLYDIWNVAYHSGLVRRVEREVFSLERKRELRPR